MEGLSPLEREQARRAYLALRDILGESFLDDALRPPRFHGFMAMVVNRAPWTRTWTTWFAQALRDLRGCPGFDGLLQRIRDPEDYPEALSVLRHAHAFHAAGFVIDIEPPTQVAGKTKKPDFKATDPEARETLYVEVTTLSESKPAQRAQAQMDAVFSNLWPAMPDVFFAGRLEKLVSEPHLQEIAQRVTAAVGTAQRLGSFQTHVEPGAIEFGVAPKEDLAILEAWAQERSLRVGEFSGPPYDSNELGRIEKRLQDEQAQLPPEFPSIVIIENLGVFLESSEPRKVVARLEEAVYSYPHLLGSIIVGTMIGPETPPAGRMIGQHAFVTRSGSPMESLSLLFLFNRFCIHKVSPGTISKLYRVLGT